MSSESKLKMTLVKAIVSTSEYADEVDPDKLESMIMIATSTMSIKALMSQLRLNLDMLLKEEEEE